MIPTDNEMCGTMVLADDSVPDGLAGTAHAHGERQQAEDGHAVGVPRQQRLVDAHACEVVDVTGLGEADNRVNQHVGLAGAGRAHGELAVSTMHGVPGLEGDDFGPAKLVEMEAEFSGSIL